MPNIQPKTETETKSYEVSSFEIHIESLELFKSVRIRVELYDAMRHFKGQRYVVLENEEYLGWLNDDIYIIQKVAEKLGFTLETEATGDE